MALSTMASSPGLQFDKDGMVLKLGEDRAAKIVTIRNGGRTFFWFQAKPIIAHMEYAQSAVTQTVNKLPEKHRKSFKELIDMGIEIPDILIFGYHDLVAMYISEPGLYELLCKSERPNARPFKDWVFEEVLPAIRETGSYQAPRRLPETSVLSVPIVKKKVVRAALPEPTLSWIDDIGATRAEVPGAKASMRLLFEIEIAAGALPKDTATSKFTTAPPLRFRALAEAALASVRDAVQRRLSTLPAAGPPPSKRARTTDPNPEDSEEDILKVSEVMQEADAWEPVWKAYMSDLSNRMVQLKCEETHGTFSERRPQEVHPGIEVDVHKYKKPEDWPLARRALIDTKCLYEKRIRELLEDVFVKVGLFDAHLSRYCTEAGRLLAAQLKTDIP